MDFTETIKSLANGENAEQVTAVLDEFNRLNTENRELDSRIRSLQDQNQRLFLRITGDPVEEAPPEEPHERTPDEAFNDFLKHFQMEETVNG